MARKLKTDCHKKRLTKKTRMVVNVIQPQANALQGVEPNGS
jgi:hypothetical protein